MAVTSRKVQYGRGYRLAVAIFVAVSGLVVGLGNARLIAAGGSPYYVIAGLALLVSSLHLARVKWHGAMLNTLVVLATLVWALWEVGTNDWALISSIAPPILLLIVLTTVPFLNTRKRPGLDGFLPRLRWPWLRAAGLCVLATFGLLLTPVAPPAGMAIPKTYRTATGRHFIGIMAGSNSNTTGTAGDSLGAFALPDRKAEK
ncbi:hypothetical protein ACFSTD_00465 [Novosphingobium colocasiae]|uniref:Membrane-bound PQQ-dependent dehydrogenase, glucose/quinate/shikimate family n=1 Tax=Novosphingobium colocasiae TaxID=1256513 RepID=A0A918PPB9_9SPHN|nr:hypothetical protein [Novosphingobium colocasiae]GGZ16468.1 hypothetical protein GCM10011614_34030 [Novosphingobium colocasiae]